MQTHKQCHCEIRILPTGRACSHLANSAKFWGSVHPSGAHTTAVAPPSVVRLCNTAQMPRVALHGLCLDNIREVITTASARPAPPHLVLPYGQRVEEGVGEQALEGRLYQLQPRQARRLAVPRLLPAAAASELMPMPASTSPCARSLAFVCLGTPLPACGQVMMGMMLIWLSLRQSFVDAS